MVNKHKQSLLCTHARNGRSILHTFSKISAVDILRKSWTGLSVGFVHVPKKGLRHLMSHGQTIYIHTSVAPEPYTVLPAFYCTECVSTVLVCHLEQSACFSTLDT